MLSKRCSNDGWERQRKEAIWREISINLNIFLCWSWIVWLKWDLRWLYCEDLLILWNQKSWWSKFEKKNAFRKLLNWCEICYFFCDHEQIDKVRDEMVSSINEKDEWIFVRLEKFRMASVLTWKKWFTLVNSVK